MNPKVQFDIKVGDAGTVYIEDNGEDDIEDDGGDEQDEVAEEDVGIDLVSGDSSRLTPSGDKVMDDQFGDTLKDGSGAINGDEPEEVDEGEDGDGDVTMRAMTEKELEILLYPGGPVEYGLGGNEVVGLGIPVISEPPSLGDAAEAAEDQTELEMEEDDAAATGNFKPFPLAVEDS
jgi:hypothetical protein